MVELEEALGLQVTPCTAEGNLFIFTTLTLGLIKDANSFNTQTELGQIPLNSTVLKYLSLQGKA